MLYPQTYQFQPKKYLIDDLNKRKRQSELEDGSGAAIKLDSLRFSNEVSYLMACIQKAMLDPTNFAKPPR